jgi:starch synthase
MKIAISATNPCHLYDLARALFQHDALGAYFSGYPAWRLHPPAGFPFRAHTARTLVTYSLLRAPAALRPANARLFRWQDEGFDRAVARDLAHAPAGIVHAMPGQARETFRAAKALGMATCLNHATGPVRQQLRALEPEWARAGLTPTQVHRFDAAYFAREEEEYALAEWHCVASQLVRDQLIAEGIAAEKIWVVPYGADPVVFHPPAAGTPRPKRRIVFAGQLTLRKGLRTLFDALERPGIPPDVQLDCYGPVNADMHGELAAIRDRSRIRVHGPVSQTVLAHELRCATLLVLPSWEEGFGLVVPQALNCGVPCVVSDRVGAKDLITPRGNGSVFAAGDAAALAAEIAWWLAHPEQFTFCLHGWDVPARQLLQQMIQSTRLSGGRA